MLHVVKKKPIYVKNFKRRYTYLKKNKSKRKKNVLFVLLVSYLAQSSKNLSLAKAKQNLQKNKKHSSIKENEYHVKVQYNKLKQQHIYYVGD